MIVTVDYVASAELAAQQLAPLVGVGVVLALAWWLLWAFGAWRATVRAYAALPQRGGWRDAEGRLFPDLTPLERAAMAAPLQSERPQRDVSRDWFGPED